MANPNTENSAASTEVVPGEHKSPHQIALERVIPAMLKGEAPLSDFVEVIEYIEGALYYAIMDFRRIASTASPDDERASSLSQEVLGSYSLHGQGLEELRKYTEDQDPAHLDNGMDIIDEATKNLVKCFKEFDDMAAAAMLKACVKCGHRNPPALSFCEKCNSKIISGDPVLEAGSSISIGSDQAAYQFYNFEMTENMQKLLDVCNGIVEGKISDEEFNRTIRWMRNLVKEARKEVADLPEKLKDIKEENEREIVQRAFDAYFEGLNLFDVALDTISRYLEERDPDHLVFGYKTAIEASIYLQGIIKLDSEIKRYREKEEEEA